MLSMLMGIVGPISTL
uniref:Uncharacterized protein n=1 Tax=Macrostomum lignano TaxID=282301 RepID=A0A1I8JMR4_9PLAT